MVGRIVPAVVLAALLFLGTLSVSCVGTGRVGVVTTFGAVTGQQLGEGLNFVMPWQRVNRMDIRTKEIMETASVPSNEGLIVNLETSLLFRLDASQVSMLYQTVGPNYVDVIVTPNLRSAIRSATATYAAEALYSTAREQVALDIFDTMTEVLSERGIIVETVLLRDVGLPQRLMDAIEAKQQAEQEALQMQFVLQKEEQEAERKRVEAAGIRDFQDIVTQTISDELLAWKGIEATETLALSPNAKIVIIGAGPNGLPIILGGG
jgi:regulator of protease activity HflC (stomatin/prohibitin superfamily)